MSKEKTKVVYKGASLSTILTIVFVILKLCGIINWSWWLVLLPSIISIGLTVLVWAVIGLILLVALIAELKDL